MDAIMLNFTGNGTANASPSVLGTGAYENFGCHWPIGSSQPYIVNVNNTPNIYVELIIYPILLCLCTVGNSLTLIMLTKDTAKSSTNVYLIGVALSDLFILWLSLLPYIALANNNVLKSPTFRRDTINFRGLHQWWLDTCVQFSDWTLIIFSLERLYAIANPFKYRYRLTVQRAVIIELVVLLLAAVCELEGITVYYYFLANDDGISKKSQIIPPSLLSWEATQTSAEVGITFAKWAVLAGLNGVLIIIMARHSMIRKSVLQAAPSTSASDSDLAARNSNIVLVSSVAVYFVTQLPNIIYRILEISSHPPFCSYNFTYRARNDALPFSHTAALTNYSINFFLYCLVWKKFRQQLMMLCCGISRKGSVAFSHGSSTLTTNVTTTPAGPNAKGRMWKLSLENREAAQREAEEIMAAYPNLEKNELKF